LNDTKLLLGIDVGTGGCKAILAAPDGTVAADCTISYPLSTPRHLWSEQDPGDWWQATCRAVAGALERAAAQPAQVAAVGLTGQMHGLVLLDGSGEVLRPAILWNDQRCAAECQEIHERLGADQVIAITGKPALPGFTAPKILWVRRHEPAVFESAESMLLPKDYVRYRLTGRLLMDVADASGTSLLDVSRRRWSGEILEALGVPGRWLPPLTESPEPAAAVSAAGASAAGLLEGTPVVAGAGDQAAEAIGCGVVADGQVSVAVGTSGVVFTPTDEYRPDPEGRLHAYCHAVPGRWHLMGVMLSAGGSLRWYRDALCEGECGIARRLGLDPYDFLLERAASVPAGSEGLLFLPYLSGERTPHADPHARGAFVGLTLRHGKAHLTRALVEGVTFGLRDLLELCRDLGGSVTRVRVSGGGARSPFWRQVMADIFGAEMVTVNTTHGAAFGAAVLAAVGVGLHPTVAEAARAAVRETGSTAPGPDASLYDRLYQRYRALYPALAEEFRAISALVARGR
jgi:xylulokinase